jgi:hypothetical protein
MKRAIILGLLLLITNRIFSQQLVFQFILDECPKLESTYGEKAVAISYGTMCELLSSAGYKPTAILPKTEEPAMRKGLKDYAVDAKSYLDKGKTVPETFRLMNPHFTQSNLLQSYNAYMNLIKLRKVEE